jgi:hypothetical protein
VYGIPFTSSRLTPRAAVAVADAAVVDIDDAATLVVDAAAAVGGVSGGDSISSVCCGDGPCRRPSTTQRSSAASSSSTGVLAIVSVGATDWFVPCASPTLARQRPQTGRRRYEHAAVDGRTRSTTGTAIASQSCALTLTAATPGPDANSNHARLKRATFDGAACWLPTLRDQSPGPI